jgi:NAD(P)-dependent dehydrogenase (short-subunit alcohol dehydrogenase family)
VNEHRPRVAVITGGASGIGLATARRLQQHDWSVVIGDINEASAERALASLDAARAAFVRTDVTREQDIVALLSAAQTRFGGLEGMVNNAGIPGAFGAITEIEVQEWDYTIAVLLRSVFLGIKHAARAFKAAGHGGAIVNVASVAGLSGGVGPQAYSAAKAAVISLTKTTAVELAADGVRVNAVAPGPVLTPILGASPGRQERAAEMLKSTQPWPQPGGPEDIAAGIAFLASSDARFITGETLVIDGGQTAAGPLESMSRLSDPRAKHIAGVDRGSTGQAPTKRTTNSDGGDTDAQRRERGGPPVQP